MMVLVMGIMVFGMSLLMMVFVTVLLAMLLRVFLMYVVLMVLFVVLFGKALMLAVLTIIVFIMLAMVFMVVVLPIMRPMTALLLHFFRREAFEKPLVDALWRPVLVGLVVAFVVLILIPL